MDRMAKPLLALFTVLCLIAYGKDAAKSAEPSLPAFLPSHYLPLFRLNDTWLVAESHQNRDGIDQYAYVSQDHAVNIIVGNLPCAVAVCETLFNNLLKISNQQATANSGNFSVVSPFEYRVVWRNGFAENFQYVSRFSNSVLIWNYSTHLDGQAQSVGQYFDGVHAQINRQRYEQALAGGNVEMGRWNTPLREHAEQLLKDGQKQEALTVLNNIVATAPTDYLSQMMLAANTSDASVAQNSARVIFRDAENADLISKSAKLLREADPASTQLPLLGKGEKGLQVILVPLAPCDLGLLAQVSEIYTGITKIPVKVMRLNEIWQFGPPDRIPNQRQIQQFITQKKGSSLDFTGWTLERYKTELIAISNLSDALTRFSVNKLMASLGPTSGQYSVDPYLEKLADILAKYRSDDPRTIYVGITEANISSGDANFVFSTTVYRPEGPVSILSYHMMLAKTLNAEYESRKRLTERIAKELVPATLNALKIPRPTDPTDPFSYSSGVDRLDQKTLTLSKPTEDALAKFR
jgi:hypothetical protein